MFVIDVAWDRPNPQELKDAGIRAVCRYLSYDVTGKNLTLGEAQSYANEGIAVVSNWEYWQDAAARGHDQGISDATAGVAQHLDCGGTKAKPIYYSVDFDIPDYRPDLPIDTDPTNNRLKLGPVAGYFQAIRDIHGAQPVGGYGGYWAISRLLNAGLIDKGWQTYGWSHDVKGGTLWDDRAVLRQIQNGIYVAGHNVDRDENMVADFGQWFPYNYAPTPSPTPAPTAQGNHAPGSRDIQLTTPYMTGDDVGYVQRFIGSFRCGPADGVYGPHTMTGVAWYQNMRGARVPGDGIMDKWTWGQMGVPCNY